MFLLSTDLVLLLDALRRLQALYEEEAQQIRDEYHLHHSVDLLPKLHLHHRDV